MVKMNKAPLLNIIQVAAEVNAALLALPGENTVVVVTKKNIGANYEQWVYDVYAGKGGVVDGKLIES